MRAGCCSAWVSDVNARCVIVSVKNRTRTEDVSQASTVHDLIKIKSKLVIVRFIARHYFMPRNNLSSVYISKRADLYIFVVI